jgi:hypothetical protein
MTKRKLWLPSDVESLKLLYSDTPMFELVKKFDRNSMSISNKAYDLGLKRSTEFLSGPYGGRIKKGERISTGTEFKKGLIPKNKGKKQSDYMNAESIAKTVATRFQKGNVPFNHKPIGYERISKDGYVEVKVRDCNVDSKNKNFEFKHRLIWKQHHGEIPKGMNVEFLPGSDKINFTICDLVLRTRKENMVRNTESDNSIIKRFLKIKEPELIEKIKNDAPEIIDLKRKEIKLKNKIKEICQSKN